MNALRKALEQSGQPVIDLNRSPTRRPHTPTGFKPGSGLAQSRPSYSKMVSASRNSASSMPTVVPAIAGEMVEPRVMAQPSKKDQLKSLCLGMIAPSSRPVPASSPVKIAIPTAAVLDPPLQTGNFAQELERRLSPIAKKSTESEVQHRMMDEEEEQEVATSISVFRYGTGCDYAALTHESSCNHQASPKGFSHATRG
ncbi:hypothetical protein AX14_008833 [Amanita brunnescens Koide BX004]|nr:hypothetical protein AX14_008833 [Amanita brunnescens Koide BX004]